MAQSICQIYVHIIFSTKLRERWISASVREDVHAYLAGILRKIDCDEVLVGGYMDHVHCLCRLNKMETAPSIVQRLKQDSSKYVKSLDERLNGFAWQKGYGLFSVSPTHLDSVRAYIRNQEEHHRVKTFQEEYRSFLEKYKVSFEEQYVWE